MTLQSRPQLGPRPTWREMAIAEAGYYFRGPPPPRGCARPDYFRLCRLRALYGPAIEEAAGFRLPEHGALELWRAK